MMMRYLQCRNFSPSPALVLSCGTVGFGKDWLAPYSGAGPGLTSPLSGAYGAEVSAILRRWVGYSAMLGSITPRIRYAAPTHSTVNHCRFLL
jgi:hypothetical protein